jgi:hypothetical protein
MEAANPTDFGLPPDSLEMLGSRAAGAKHFRLAGGEFKGVFGNGQHYDDRGQWEDIVRDWAPSGSDQLVNKHHTNAAVISAGIEMWMPKDNKGIRWLTPSRATTDGVFASHPEMGRTWRHFVTRRGNVKAEAIVTTPQGARTYSFRYEMIGGAGGLEVAPDGSLQGEGLHIPRVVVQAKHARFFVAGAWRIDSGVASFDWDDGVVLLEDYPYVIDPSTTFSGAGGANDGNVTRFSSSNEYPPEGTITLETAAAAAYCEKEREGTTRYDVHCTRFRWDTSSLDDAAIVSAANMVVQVEDSTDNASRNLVVDYLDTALSTSDWVVLVTGNAYDTDLGTHMPENGQVGTWPLLNVAANIHVDAYTGLNIGISGGAPPDITRGYIGFNTEEHATADVPKLEVTYSLPSSPGGGIAQSLLTAKVL